MRSLLTLGLLFVGISTVAAQDRPLIETLRIGITRGELIAGNLQPSNALGSALRGKGILVKWHEYTAGLETIDALSSGAVDIALGVDLHQMVTAKSKNLNMVLIAEFRSFASLCCELEEAFSHQSANRYALSSEYIADFREDIVLLLHREISIALQFGPGPIGAQAGSRAVAIVDDNGSRLRAISPPSRVSIEHACRHANISIDLADMNYWEPNVMISAAPGNSVVRDDNISPRISTYH
jgi:hypothetical protein